MALTAKVKIKRKYSLLKKLGKLEIEAAQMRDVFAAPNLIADSIHEAWIAVLNARRKEEI